MKEIEPQLIPTLSKAKISGRFSYPVGAEQLSSALASSSQFQELRLHFYSSKSNHALGWGHYEFLRVEYLNSAKPAEEWPIQSLYQRPPQYRWEVVVQPVPRLLRRVIRQYIIEHALPAISRWLAERAGLKQKGSDMLTFFYDEKTAEFASRSLTRLEPLTLGHRSPQ